MQITDSLMREDSVTVSVNENLPMCHVCGEMVTKQRVLDDLVCSYDSI